MAMHLKSIHRSKNGSWIDTKWLIGGYIIHIVYKYVIFSMMAGTKRDRERVK